MGIIGSAIGGALGIGASIFGGISASNAMKKVKNNLEGRISENQNWYDRRYNEDATQRADAQRILAKTEESIRNRNRNAAAAAAVTGASEESRMAQMAANNDALAEAASQIAMSGDRRKDRIEERYMETKSGLEDKINDMERAKAAAVSEAVKGVAQAGSEMGSVF